MINCRELEATLGLNSRLRKQYAKELKKLPKGRLYFKKEHGHYRPYVRRRGKEKYIRLDESDLISLLARKQEVKESIDKLDENIKTLRAVRDGYTNIEDVIPETDRIPFKGKSRKEMQKELDDWVRREQMQNQFRSFDKRLETSDGVLVRSRAELILWEHFGMMDSDVYRANARKKLKEYALAGYWPMENLICTYDFGDGELSVHKLEQILIMMGLLDEAAVSSADIN